jgi:predicted ArsR family transcriptional regulator
MLLERVSGKLASKYASTVRSTALHQRVEELAGALSAQGILTDVVEQSGDLFILKTYNCPYHELAQEHREVCDMDQHMLRTVLGSDVSLSACMMDGHAGCSFVVAKTAGVEARA